MKSLGVIHYRKGERRWLINAVPHVRMMLRRIFVSALYARNVIEVSDTLDSAETLVWILDRYPMELECNARAYLRERAEQGRKLRSECEQVVSGGMKPRALDMKLPLREYQLQGVELLRLKRRLLCGDDLGLGKTAIGLGAIASGLNPAIVVCQTHLQEQWKNEAMKFLKRCFPLIVKKGTPYRLPGHNLLIIPYSKLAGWADALFGQYQLVIFDEVQELRREESSKYRGAVRVAAGCEYTLGLSATPVYNYGDEIFNILDAIEEGCLGTRNEFLREWCEAMGVHSCVRDPEALGSYLQAQNLFLRRRRKDVGRELPPVIRVVETVDHDPKRLKEATERGLQLAAAVLEGDFASRGLAARELDGLMRQQTGIAKAPFVAAFVADLVNSGESVVLCGWHREVYDVWRSVLREGGIDSVMYTGSETPAEKAAAVELFVSGSASVFIMSLRSGAGLNRLQERASVIVFGELDWSPQVHEQCIGRLRRDGQEGQVTAVFLVSEEGSDPIVSSVLGLKREQAEGIVDGLVLERDVAMQQVEESRISMMAREILKKHGSKPELIA